MNVDLDIWIGGDWKIHEDNIKQNSWFTEKEKRSSPGSTTVLAPNHSTGKIKESNSRFTKQIKLNSRLTEKIKAQSRFTEMPLYAP